MDTKDNNVWCRWPAKIRKSQAASHVSPPYNAFPLSRQAQTLVFFGFSKFKLGGDTFGIPKEVITAEENNKEAEPSYIFMLMLCGSTSVEQIALLCLPIV